MLKKKYELEYIIKSSPGILYSRLGTPEGLEQWFAGSVEIDEDIFTFTWGNDVQQAKIIDKKDNAYIRFQWIDEPEDNYFEFRIEIDDVTSEVALIITDFIFDDNIEEERQLWDNQVNNLMHIIGS